MKKIFQILVCFWCVVSFQNLVAQKIEAEAYTTMSGVKAEVCSDVGAGQQLGYINSGDWVEYTVAVGSAGAYNLDFRVATATNGGTIRILQNGTIIGHAIVENTGGWSSWTTVSIPVKFLTSGSKTIRLEITGASGDLFNLNWIQLTNKNLSTSSFTFDSEGIPTSLIINGVEIEDGTNGFNSFNLIKFDGVDLVTTNDFSASVSAGVLTLSANNETLILKFRIDTYPRHVSLHLIDVQGIDGKKNISVGFQFVTNRALGFLATNQMLETSFSSRFKFRSNWNYLSHPGIEGYKGGLVFWDGSLTGAALDETLAEIWTTEANMPKPAQQDSWTESDVLNWVDNYASKFNNMSTALIEPTSLEDLYSLVNNYVIPNKIKQVYLHCGVWRGEYWLNNYSRVHVNTNIFPNGEDDLKAFADYLHANNLLIHLHSLSFGIGLNDPDYILGGVDRRLGSWGKGKLEYPISATDKVIYFRPDEGIIVPYPGIRSHEQTKMDYQYFRLGDEIVESGSIDRTDKEVWILSNCTRARGGTEACAFTEGEDVSGLYFGYGRNFIPGLDLGEENSLANELVLEYATFVNEMGLDQLHFDGIRLNDITPYTHESLYSKVYSYTNRPVTTSKVGGQIDANFELKFSQVKDEKTYNYKGIEVGIRLDDDKNGIATSFLGVQFHINETLVSDARRVSLTGSYHDLGVSTASIAGHGLSSEIFKIVAQLQELTPVFDDVDVSYLATTMTKIGTHYRGDYVNVLSKNASNQYIYTPYLVLGLSDGSTDPWMVIQEIGAQPRQQTTATGATLTLTNPDPQSDLNIIFHISDATKSLVNPKVTLGNGGNIQFTGTIAPGQYLQYEAGATTATCYDKNWNVVSTISVTKSNFIAVNGNFTALLTGTVAGVAVDTQYYVKGTPYVLATNAKL